MADIGLAATGSNLIVIGQIYIEDQLLCHRTKCGSLAQRFSVSRIGGVYWTYFKTGRIETQNIFSKAISYELFWNNERENGSMLTGLLFGSSDILDTHHSVR